MKYCICFFGVVSRSIGKTFDSINENILKVLEDANIDYDIFVHNLTTPEINNNFTKEHGCKINNDLWKSYLKPTAYLEESQSEFDASYDWGFIRHLGHQRIGDESNRNAIRELYSVKQVTSLWKNRDKYDMYLYFRPDLKYIDKLDTKQLLNNPDRLFTPSWDKWKGLNDRIYFGQYDTILPIAERIDYLDELMFKRKIPYNAEHYMKIVVKHFKLSTVDIKIRGARIRASGVDKDKGRDVFN